MNKYDVFEQLNINTEAQIGYAEFVINIFFVILLSLILEWTYVRCAKSISNRKLFSSNFTLIAFTTMLIITVVKSSIALSLGLVGALSIVRFRSAIKEPEELAYIFLTIAIGLGLGANQRVVTIIAFAAIILMIWVRYFSGKKQGPQNLFITISMNSDKIDFEEVFSTVREVFGKVKVNRYDKRENSFETTLLVETANPRLLKNCTDLLEKRYSGVSVSYIDYQ